MVKIKFRVWDRKGNLFLPRQTAGYITSDGEYYCGFAAEHTGDKDNFVIQFSTGIKDKNGKEIYEGDILACSWDFNPDYKSVGYVVFWEGSFHLAKNKEPEYPEFGPYELWGFNDTPTRNYFWNQAEVIGNIYEN